MELDDLKHTWKQTNLNKPTNTNIMELIQHKSYGPIAALKRGFKKQMVLIPCIMAILITNLSRNHDIFSDLMFWSFMVFCAALVVFFYFNYRFVSKMESMEGMIKPNLEKQIAILESRLRLKMIGLRVALLFFIAMAEVLPHFQPEPMLNKWLAVAIPIRLLVYAALLTLQYFASRAVSKRRFGQHLSYLKELVKEIQ